MSDPVKYVLTDQTICLFLPYFHGLKKFEKGDVVSGELFEITDENIETHNNYPVGKYLLVSDSKNGQYGYYYIPFAFLQKYSEKSTRQILTLAILGIVVLTVLFFILKKTVK